MLLVIYAKILHHGFIPTIYDNFKSVFFIYLVQTKIRKLVYRFDLEIIKAILRYFYWIIFKQMNIISKMQQTMFAKNYYM